MRYLVAFVAALGLAACGGAPASPSQGQAPGPAPVAAPVLQSASVDSTIQFLLTAAATDFRAHRPPDPARFRDVRFGEFVSSSGQRVYLLCGQFLPAQEGGDWTLFATIKTSPYEQWLGAQAAGFCQNPSVTWHPAGDLSSSLWSRLESLR